MDIEHASIYSIEFCCAKCLNKIIKERSTENNCNVRKWMNVGGWMLSSSARLGSSSNWFSRLLFAGVCRLFAGPYCKAAVRCRKNKKKGERSSKPSHSTPLHPQRRMNGKERKENIRTAEFLPPTIFQSSSIDGQQNIYSLPARRKCNRDGN